MAEQRRRSGAGHLLSKVDIGFGLLSFTLAIVVATVSTAVALRESLGLTLLVVAAGIALTAVLWVSAIRNGRVERAARIRLQGEHPGALVERVRLWSLPHGRVDRDLAIHFLVADAREILFETIDQTVLLRIPVDELGFVDLLAAQGDRARDLAVTLIYQTRDDEQGTVQLFTLTYAGSGTLRARIRTAIGWPADGTPTH